MFFMRQCASDFHFGKFLDRKKRVFVFPNPRGLIGVFFLKYLINMTYSFNLSQDIIYFITMYSVTVDLKVSITEY